MCNSPKVIAQNAPALAAPGGPIVIDNSSAFRYDPQYPLVVPEASAPIPSVSFERGMLRVKKHPKSNS